MKHLGTFSDRNCSGTKHIPRSLHDAAEARFTSLCCSEGAGASCKPIMDLRFDPASKTLSDALHTVYSQIQDRPYCGSFRRGWSLLHPFPPTQNCQVSSQPTLACSGESNLMHTDVLVWSCLNKEPPQRLPHRTVGNHSGRRIDAKLLHDSNCPSLVTGSRTTTCSDLPHHANLLLIGTKAIHTHVYRTQSQNSRGYLVC